MVSNNGGRQNNGNYTGPNAPKATPKNPWGVEGAVQGNGGGGGGNGGGGGGNGGGHGLPGYHIPGVPDAVGGPLVLQGQFADQMTAAQRAFKDAQDQLAYQKSQTYGNLGMRQDGKGWNDDATSQWGQLSGQLGQSANVAQENVYGRGLQGGAAAQNMALNKAGNDVSLGNFLKGAANSTAALDQQGLDQVQNFGQQQSAIRQGMIDYMIQNGQHVTADGQLNSDEVKARTKALAGAWMKTFGGGKNSENKKGQTYQAWLNSLGAKLYDPNAKYGIGHTNYGGN